MGKALVKIENLNVRPDTIRLLEENTGKTFYINNY